MMGEGDAELLALAQDAFTHGTQATAFIAAALLLLAAAMAWRLIPSAPTPRS
jgi:DHA2 family multidrug resistance protein-like MFS transporter